MLPRCARDSFMFLSSFFSPRSTVSSFHAYAGSLLLLSVITGLGFLLDLRVAPTNLAMLYLAAVVVTALKWGFRPAVASSIVSSFVFDYFFIPPYFSFAITDVWYLITLTTMVGMGVLTSRLASSAREQMFAAAAREAHIRALYTVTQLLSSLKETDEIATSAGAYIEKAFARPVALLLRDGEEQLSTRYKPSGWILDESTILQANIILERARHDSKLRRERTFVPLRVGTQIFGAIVFLPADSALQLSDTEENVLAGVAGQVALAIHRSFLEIRAKEAERLERERERARAAKAEAIADLAGGLAHDLNNLLTGVLGNIGLADAMLENHHPARSCLRDALASGERAATVVAQILAYAGKGRLFDEPLDLSQAVTEFVRSSTVATPRHIRLETALSEALPLLRTDPNQIRQLIGNLYLNAIEAIGDKPGTVTMGTGVEHIAQQRALSSDAFPAGDYIYLQVIDTGCGIDEQIQSRIFDPFFTTKFVGRGLGLAAAHGIVRAHGGAITVSSQVGVGSTLTCLFPVEQDPPVPAFENRVQNRQVSGGEPG